MSGQNEGHILRMDISGLRLVMTVVGDRYFLPCSLGLYDVVVDDDSVGAWVYGGLENSRFHLLTEIITSVTTIPKHYHQQLS